MAIARDGEAFMSGLSRGRASPGLWGYFLGVHRSVSAPPNAALAAPVIPARQKFTADSARPESGTEGPIEDYLNFGK